MDTIGIEASRLIDRSRDPKGIPQGWYAEPKGLKYAAFIGYGSTPKEAAEDLVRRIYTETGIDLYWSIDRIDPRHDEIDPQEETGARENVATLPDPETDRLWTVRIVRKGESYGRGDCIVHTGESPLIEFYDAEQNRNVFGPYGQFVARYSRETLDTPIRQRGKGLMLDGDIPIWTVSGAVVDVALSLARRADR